MHYLDDYVDVVDRLMMLFWRVRRYTINVLYRCGVSPFPCGCYRFPLLAVGLVKEDLECCPCLLAGGLTLPLPDVFVEYLRMSQQGNNF